jgi:dUTP pyrophosphatase
LFRIRESAPTSFRQPSMARPSDPQPSDRPLLRVKRLRPHARLPDRATEGSTGLDLLACLDEPGYLKLGRDPARVPTGVALEIPPGFDAQVRPRSGLSTRGVAVAFGTIDSDYRGEVLVTMYVLGSLEEYRINDGDRIAQLVVSRLAELPIVEVEELSTSARGSGGHGSTGR